MIIEKVFVVLLDYADEKVGESGIELLGTFRNMESAQKKLQDWKNELLGSGSWEGAAYFDYQKDGTDSGYDFSEDEYHFEIAENFRYDSQHTYCRIVNQTLED